MDFGGRQTNEGSEEKHQLNYWNKAPYKSLWEKHTCLLTAYISYRVCPNVTGIQSESAPG